MRIVVKDVARRVGTPWSRRTADGAHQHGGRPVDQRRGAPMPDSSVLERRVNEAEARARAAEARVRRLEHVLTRLKYANAAAWTEINRLRGLRADERSGGRGATGSR